MRETAELHMSNKQVPNLKTETADDRVGLKEPQPPIVSVRRPGPGSVWLHPKTASVPTVPIVTVAGDWLAAS